MIFSILLLITLTSCVSGSLVVNVIQSSYQAEENHNVTLEWTFTTRTDGSPKSISIICEMLTAPRPFVLFDLREGYKDPKTQDERFAGRVRCDKDVLREGRLRLHMSRLRTDDSGDYQCRVNTGFGWRLRKYHLNVTAERDRPKPETPNSRGGGRDPSPTGSPPQPESPGWIGLYCVVGLIEGTLLGVSCALYHFLYRKQANEHKKILSLLEEMNLKIHSLSGEQESTNQSLSGEQESTIPFMTVKFLRDKTTNLRI